MRWFLVLSFLFMQTISENVSDKDEVYNDEQEVADHVAEVFKYKIQKAAEATEPPGSTIRVYWIKRPESSRFRGRDDKSHGERYAATFTLNFYRMRPDGTHFHGETQICVATMVLTESPGRGSLIYNLEPSEDGNISCKDIISLERTEETNAYVEQYTPAY